MLNQALMLPNNDVQLNSAGVGSGFIDRGSVPILRV